MTLVCTHSLDHDKKMHHSFFLDHHIQESTTIDLTPVECERDDGSKFTYFKGEFDIIMGVLSSEKEDK